MTAWRNGDDMGLTDSGFQPGGDNQLFVSQLLNTLNLGLDPHERKERG